MEIQEERVMFVLCTVSCWDLFFEEGLWAHQTDKIHRQLHTKYKRNAFCAAPGTRQVTQSSWPTPVGYMGGSWQSYNLTASPQAVQFGRKPFLT